MVRESRMRWIRGRGRCKGWGEYQIESRSERCISFN